MSQFKTDNYGWAFKPADIKIATGTWNMHLSQIGIYKDQELILYMRTVEEPEYLFKMLDKRKDTGCANTFVVSEIQYAKELQDLKTRYQNIKTAVLDSVSLNVAIINGKTVWINSQGSIAKYGYVLTTGIHDELAADTFKKYIKDRLQNQKE